MGLRIIIGDWKSLDQVVCIANSADSSVIQQQSSVAVLSMPGSILIMWAPGHCGLSGSKLADHQAILGAAETHPDKALEPASLRALIRHSCHPFPSNTSGWRRCIRLSLMSRSKRPLLRLNTPIWLASTVVITLLFDAGRILCESPRMLSSDCVVRKWNLQNTYDYDIRHFWWNNIIATFAIRWMNSIPLPCAALALLRIILRRLQ